MATVSQQCVSSSDELARRLHRTYHDETLPTSVREQAWQEFFWLFRRMAVKYGHQVLPDWGSRADDIQQTTYLAIWEAFKVWNPERGPFPVALKYYMHNVIRNWLRQEEMIVRSHNKFQTCHKRRQQGEDTAHLDKIECHSLDALRSDTDSELDKNDCRAEFADPNAEFADKITLQVAVRQLVESLPMHERKVVKTYFGLDDDTPRTLRETAEIVGRSHEAVRITLARAQRSLRTSFQGFI